MGFSVRSWSKGTHRAYQPKIAFLLKFQALFPGLHVLSDPHLASPPTGPAIPLAWAELAYSLRSGRHNRGGGVTFSTTRQLRSAAGWDHVVCSLNGRPTGLMYDAKLKGHTRQAAHPNLEATLRHFTIGFHSRLGTGYHHPGQ